MLHEMTNCPKCRKVFTPLPGQKWCSECTAQRVHETELVEDAITRRSMRDPKEIAELTDVPLKIVEAIVRRWRLLYEATETELTCARCEREPVQPGSEYCPNCRIELYSKIGRMTDRLYSEVSAMEYVSPQAKNVSHLRAAMQNKRARASAERLRPRRQRLK